MPLASSNKIGHKKIETLKGPGRWILLLDYSNQGGLGGGGVGIFKGVWFEFTELSNHF